MWKLLIKTIHNLIRKKEVEVEKGVDIWNDIDKEKKENRIWDNYNKLMKAIENGEKIDKVAMNKWIDNFYVQERFEKMNKNLKLKQRTKLLDNKLNNKEDDYEHR